MHQQNVRIFVFCKAKNTCICNILHSWTFSKGKCSAPTKCTHCLCFLHVLCFFAFCKAKNTAFLRFRGALTFCFAKMLCFLLCKKQRCCPYILLVLNIFLWKMWCWTFYKVKCDAEYFPLENVMLNIFLWKMYALLNIFLWKMYAEHFLLENVRQNAFWHQMHFGIKCILASNAFVTFCFAEHFPLENVRWTFSKGKCTQKCICNILCYKMYASNAFVTFCVTKCTHQMHLMRTFCNTKCYKCIFATHQQNVRIFVFCKAKNTAFLHSWTFSKGKCSAPTKCKGSTKYIFASFFLVFFALQKRKKSVQKMHFLFTAFLYSIPFFFKALQIVKTTSSCKRQENFFVK